MAQTLVTGAGGFAGRHVVAELQQAGVEVTAWARADVDLLDRDSVRARICDLRPRYVYHCAGAPHVAHSWNDTVRPLRSNVLATHYLLDALRRAASPCRVLITGSATVYKPSSEPLTEAHPTGPTSPYALSKLAQEELGLRAVREDSLDVIVTRSFNHTGPWQEPAFAAPGYARQLAEIEAGRAEPVLRVGNTHARRDLTDVRDVARAYRLLMEKGRPGNVYNVCCGKAYAMAEVAAVLRSHVAVPVQLEVDAGLLRPHDAPLLVGDPSRLKAETGWEPAIPFDRMLEDLLAHWRRVVGRREEQART
jgi:GDP-4-dehydro-6-deoxy-D-mannose reductase